MASFLKPAALACLLAAASCSSMQHRAAPSEAAATSPSAFERAFDAPAATAKPWVYWYFMDGHITREGLLVDLESMKQSGIGGAIFLTVDIGVPRGPVAFMSPQWQDLFAYAVKEADRLGIEITLGVGPGWTGAGGPWVTPEDSMQHVVGTATSVKGGAPVEVALPQPTPREPFFGRGPLTPAMMAEWRGFYRDVAVLAYPTPRTGAKVAAIDEKAMVYRAPYSSAPNVRPYFEASAAPASMPADQCLDRGRVLDLTDKLGPDGRLRWDAPAGDWTVYRFGRTLTGQTSRPAPLAGLGFESDKFSRTAVERHIHSFLDPLLDRVGKASGPHRGLTLLHLDSWEMGSQNWSPVFRDEFTRRRGYDPVPFLPAILGQYVGDALTTERFLWDLRRTARELLFENQAVPLRDYAHRRGLEFSAQSYDMNPSGDLKLGSIADVPMGEFWSWGIGFSTEFSVIEAVSIAHTNGKPIVGGEAFTAEGTERWQQYPARMKAQTDWAFAAGLNRFVIHRYQHQPKLNESPGMRMGQYGVHWERTETFWPMVDAYHSYLTRCSDVLRIGTPVADILYLAPEGAPHVFRPPASATRGEYQDRRGYNFDGCDPDTLIERATVADGKISFPDGMSYRVLILPRFDTMTPALLRKVKALLEAGATVVGTRPRLSPGLGDQPAADAEVAALARELWGDTSFIERSVGKGKLVNDAYIAEPPESGNALADAKWIWFDDGTASADAPPETCAFERRFSIAVPDKLVSARLWVGADDNCAVYVNGQKVVSDGNHGHAANTDVRRALVPGENVIRVVATNAGNSPNPAGVIGVLSMKEAGGSARTLVTDAEWTASRTPEGPRAQVKVINDLPGAWKNSRPPEVYRDLYPDYDTTARLLASMGAQPDFTSDVDLRYTHRKDGDIDLYFIANPADAPIETTAAFRVAEGSAEWWNPLTGERRALSDAHRHSGTTRLRLKLAPTESGFVVFRPGAASRSVEVPPARSARVDLAGPWTVKFDPRWGGPSELKLDTLTDWSKHPDPAVHFYSGQAVYQTRFDLDAAQQRGTTLSLGDVRVIARVKLNGTDLGTAWCAPWQFKIPAGLLRDVGNELEVTVANQWTNRLIGDSALPVEKRLTATSSNPFKPNDALQPSGLIGPVRLTIR